jgi:hypothetical protein
MKGSVLEKQLRSMRFEGTRAGRREASLERVQRSMIDAGMSVEDVRGFFGFGTGKEKSGGVSFKGFRAKLDKSKLPETRKAVAGLIRNGDAIYERLEKLAQMLSVAKQELDGKDMGQAAETAVSQAETFMDKAVDALDDALHVATSLGNMLR